MLDELLDPPGAALRYLVAHDAFQVVEPLDVSAFVRYCKEHGVRVDAERLERLEQLGVFYPAARVEYPRIQVKIKRVGENRVQNLGMLQEGETWPGELQEENSRFSWHRSWAQAWLDEGRLWDPRERPFVKWSTFRPEESWEPHISTFYTPYQAFVLKNVLTARTMRIAADDVVGWDEDGHARFGKTLTEWATAVMRDGHRHRSDAAAFLAQVLSNRYYFFTRSDRRTIVVTEASPFEPWDWNEYRRGWDARAVMNDLGLTAENIEDLHGDLSFLATINDPLRRWYELVSFVSVDQRDKLQDMAQFARLGYTMEEMVRLFYADATGKQLRPPHERHAGVHVENDEDNESLDRELEYTANQFNLNPKPKLVLVVEGNGEETELPRVAHEVLGYDFRQLGIDVRNLHGIGNFTGAKAGAPYGALERFIDDHHARQTIVFCVLDREGRAVQVRDRLITADSTFVPGRKVTRPDYIHLWNDSIEFDNFTDAEIGDALTRVAEGVYAFSEAEVAAARAAKATKGNPLHSLYLQKTSHDLNKIDLLHELFDRVIENRDAEMAAATRRPILSVLLRVVELAAGNHQAVSSDLWRMNQASGYFGSVAPGSTLATKR